MKEQLSIIEFVEQSKDASMLDKTIAADTSLLDNIKGLSIQATER
jgi:hypothetical protein